MKILSIFVAFLENINFTNLKIQIRLHKKFGRFVKSSYTPVYCNFAHVTHLAFGVRIFKSAAALWHAFATRTMDAQWGNRLQCTARPKINYQFQISRYARSIFWLRRNFQPFLIFAFIGCPYSVICHISMYLMVSWPDLCPLSLENVYLAFLAYHMVLSRDLGY